MASVVTKVSGSSGRSIEVSQLSEGELRVLRLLAQGHTVKSIASTLDSTPTAINERLRQARRKTGVGSSREVARLLTAQENRDEKIELDLGSDGRSNSSWVSEGRYRALWLGAIVMIFAVVAALVIATHTTDQPSTNVALNNEAIIDSIVGPIPSSSEFGSDQLYLRLRAEKRDTDWAARTEQALGRYLTLIPYVAVTGERLRVTCGRTLCEAAGIIEAPMAKQVQSSVQPRVNRSMQKLQGKDIHDYAASLGLDVVGALFSSSDHKTATTFLIYFQRNR